MPNDDHTDRDMRPRSAQPHHPARRPFSQRHAGDDRPPQPDDDHAALTAELDRLSGQARALRAEHAALSAKNDRIAAEMAGARLLVLESRRLRLLSRHLRATSRAIRARIAHTMRRGS